MKYLFLFFLFLQQPSVAQGVLKKPAKTGAYLQKQVDTLWQSNVFNNFADSCIRNNAGDYLMQFYKKAIDDGKMEMLPVHVGFLLKLFKKIDRTHPSQGNYFTCFYLGRIITKYHLDHNAPIQFYNDAVAMALKLNDHCLAVKAYFNLAVFYTNVQHDLVKANEYYDFIKQYAAREKISPITDCNVDVNTGTSVINYYLQDYAKGIEQINESIAVLKKLNRPRQLYDLYKRRSFFQLEQANYTGLLQSIDTAEMIVKNIPENASFLNHIMAVRFIGITGLGKNKEALPMSEKIHAEALKDDNDDYFEYMYSLIKVQMGFGLITEAETNIQRYMVPLKPWNTQRWRRLYEVKYLLAKQMNDCPSALKAYQSYKYFDDSVHHQRQLFTVLQQQVKYETKEKEKSLQAQVAINNTYFWSIISVALMAAVIILLVYANNRKSKKSVIALTSLNQQVNAQKTALEKADKEKDRLLQVVAHDLRSPVGITSYVADMLLMEDDVNDKNRQQLNMIQQASGNALLLINELLGLRVDADERQMEKVGLAQLMRGTIQMLLYKAAEKKQVIDLDLPTEEICIYANGERIGRMINNLVLNAIKFSKKNSSITVSLQREGKNALITVKDNGIGIPRHLQGEVFDMFTTAKQSGTAGEKSFGLGLSICKQIVEEYEGFISFESEAGSGTTFYIQLPLCQDV